MHTKTKHDGYYIRVKIMCIHWVHLKKKKRFVDLFSMFLHNHTDQLFSLKRICLEIQSGLRFTVNSVYKKYIFLRTPWVYQSEGTKQDPIKVRVEFWIASIVRESGRYHDEISHLSFTSLETPSSKHGFLYSQMYHSNTI